MVVDEDTAWIRRSPNEVRLAIHVTVRNEDTRSLYVTPCSHRLQRSASSGWYTVWATPCFPGRLYSLALVPGEATVITIEAHTGVDSSAWPATAEPGLYRVILALTTVPLNVGGHCPDTGSRSGPHDVAICGPGAAGRLLTHCGASGPVQVVGGGCRG